MDSDNNNQGVTFTKSKRGQRQLVKDGFMYNFHKASESGDIWRCVNRSQCSTLIKIRESGNQVHILNEGSHKCEANVATIEIIKMKNECKEMAAQSTSSMPKIYEEVFQKAKDSGYQLLNVLPKYENIKRSLYDARLRELNVPKTHFTKREDIVIPEKYSDLFLLFDDTSDPENRIIAFSTMKARDILSNLKRFLGDGTFQSCYRLFYELYCIHGDLNSTEQSSNIIPLIYVLMPNKEQQTYVKLLKLLKENLPKWEPKEFIIDFEQAVINALRIFFPSVSIQGCNFHFKQALTKKAHVLGIQNVEEKKHVALCSALAHIRLSDIDEGWLIIMEEAVLTEAVTAFNDYFVAQWLEKEAFREIWNCYNRRHRTINGVEAWHRRLNSKMPKKPDLLQLLHIIKNEAEHFDLKMQKLECGVQITMRKRRPIAFDRELREIIDNYDQTTLKETITKISLLQHLNNM